jgi:hypothetical protein
MQRMVACLSNGVHAGPFYGRVSFYLSLVGCGDNTHSVQQSWELILERIMYFQQCVNLRKSGRSLPFIAGSAVGFSGLLGSYISASLPSKAAVPHKSRDDTCLTFTSIYCHFRFWPLARRCTPLDPLDSLCVLSLPVSRPSMLKGAGTSQTRLTGRERAVAAILHSTTPQRGTLAG